MSIYDELAVKRYINAWATVTLMGGSIMPVEVLDAMREAAKNYVSIAELQKKAGDYIANLTKNEAAMVSSGATAGIILATAACIAGDDPVIQKKLPFSEGLANEILLHECNRSNYEFALKQAGGKIVIYGDSLKATEEQLENAITKNTAAIFIFYYEHRMEQQLPVDVQAAIAKKHGIPVIIDAAAQIPKKENLWRFTRDLGADIVIFSGGKGLCGPQSSGLVVGKRLLIDRMVSIASPNIGIGRPMKVGKEEIAGLLAAVKRYVESDEEEIINSYEMQVKKVLEVFQNNKALTVTRDFPSEAGQPMPRAKITPCPNFLRINARELSEKLRLGEPGILVASTDDSIFINPQTLQPGEIEIVIDKLQEIVMEYQK